jgi:hypothetical protein
MKVNIDFLCAVCLLWIEFFPNLFFVQPATGHIGVLWRQNEVSCLYFAKSIPEQIFLTAHSVLLSFCRNY